MFVFSSKALKPLEAFIVNVNSEWMDNPSFFIQNPTLTCWFKVRLTVAGSEVWVSETAVFAQAANNDGDAGEEEDQTYNNPCHHQWRHQQRRLPP